MIQKKKDEKAELTIVEKNNSLSTNWWNKQLQQWKKGERNSLQIWRQKSVKQYVDGKLSKDRIQKLKDVGILK